VGVGVGVDVKVDMQRGVWHAHAAGVSHAWV